MTEAQIVAKIRLEFQKQLPSAKFLKHNDFSTEGIPDCSVSFNGRTTWVEVKLLKDRETQATFTRHIKPGGRLVQLTTCCQLQEQARCFYLIAYPRQRLLHGVILQPSRVRQLLEYKTFDPANLVVLSALGQDILLKVVDDLVYIVRIPRD